MKKPMLIVLGVLIAVGSGQAVSTKKKIDVVLQGSESNWSLYVFGTRCEGTLQVVQPKDSTDPIKLVCK